MVHVVDRVEELKTFLPRLTALLEAHALLLVLDNLESLLKPEGGWWDERWGLVMAALFGHRGLSRTVLTSRIRPRDLPASVQVEPIHSLSLAETVLLTWQLPNLGRLLHSDRASRELVRRILLQVQGHPKLIELVEAQAADVPRLRRQVEQAEAAAASRANGGSYRGVAPEAKLISCKTWFYNSELIEIYDTLGDHARAGEVIVASNSFGVRTSCPPPLPDDHSLFMGALDDAIAAGVHVVFSGGNYHDLVGGKADASGPNSIWLEKGRSDVLTVATCDLERRMWYYSSRGPGQFYGTPGTSRKPDVTAPTPRNGRILYGGEEVVMPDGWGTSGAAPQVAGLLALFAVERAEIASRRAVRYRT
jgi:hypothetical protein